MDDAKQQLVDKLKTANNILVTVSRDPSVDQLAACLGLALVLNKQGKHTAAVFSGQVPSTIEFLKPEETLEKTTDSLRDFIIALDKSKADKLRYKVEDNVVRIFITPYKTSITEADLDFSQGDFNVDVVVALGVGKQEDLDEAITAHGRILHDATVASINTAPDGGLGSINWHDPQASSLCELVTNLALSLDPSLLDAQIATALLTGIVASTNRFGNDKTSSQTMSVSSTLLAAGANQQLVASKLEEPVEPVSTEDSADQSNDDGTIEIEHDSSRPDDKPAEEPPIDLPAPDDSAQPEDSTLSEPPVEATPPPVDVPVEPPVESTPPEPPEASGTLSPGSKLITEPPTLGGTLTANSQPAELDPVTDPMSMPTSEAPQLLERPSEPPTGFTPPPTDWNPPTAAPAPMSAPAEPPQPEAVPPADYLGSSLSDLEEEVKASEQQATDGPEDLGDARDEVSRALNTGESTLPPKPIEALNAQPLGDSLHGEPATPPPPLPVPDPQLSAAPDSTQPTILPPTPQPPQPTDQTPPATPPVSDLTAPPPVPPPIPFQFGNPNPPQQ